MLGDGVFHVTLSPQQAKWRGYAIMVSLFF
jgi:hypothetical protein